MWIASGVATVFAALALLHLYWALGGRWGADSALPHVAAPATRGDDPLATSQARPMVRAFNPGRSATLVVAASLAGVAALVAMQAGLLGGSIDHPAVRWALVVVAVVLLLRAVGDFRLVGFFKKITGSRFARLDTLVFSPLCVVLGLSLLVVASV